MKLGEWNRQSAPLEELLDGFQRCRWGFVRKHEWIAECLFADSSQFDGRAFYVEAFPLPLFVPTTHLYFDYGFRVGDRWDAVDRPLVAAVRRALPQLAAVSTLQGLREAASVQSNAYHAEIRICLAVISDDSSALAASRNNLEQLIATAPWEADVLSRSRELLDVLGSSGRDAAIDVLTARRNNVLPLVCAD
jgi:hypothetical protein